MKYLLICWSSCDAKICILLLGECKNMWWQITTCLHWWNIQFDYQSKQNPCAYHIKPP